MLFALVVSLAVPLFIGALIAYTSQYFMVEPGNRLLLTVLCASASYIAVPAAMKNALPNANPGIYTSMALGITFPVNIVIGIPLYFAIIEML